MSVNPHLARTLIYTQNLSVSRAHADYLYRQLQRRWSSMVSGFRRSCIKYWAHDNSPREPSERPLRSYLGPNKEIIPNSEEKPPENAHGRRDIIISVSIGMKSSFQYLAMMESYKLLMFLYVLCSWCDIFWFWFWFVWLSPGGYSLSVGEDSQLLPHFRGRLFKFTVTQEIMWRILCLGSHRLDHPNLMPKSGAKNWSSLPTMNTCRYNPCVGGATTYVGRATSAACAEETSPLPQTRICEPFSEIPRVSINFCQLASVDE